MRFAEFAKVIPALLGFLLVFAAPVQAQNNKPVRSGNWYEDRASINIGGNLATLWFAQAPADKFLNITHVACDIETALGWMLGRTSVGGSTTNGMAGDLGRSQSIRGTVEAEVSISFRYYSVVTDTFLKLGPGRFPFISITSASAPNASPSQVIADCTIVGNLSDD
ncbi:hypothetical protein ACWAT4_20010 [Bradyrhizobium manausense]